MKALIDADMLLYEYGSLKDDEGNPLKWPFVKQRLDARIHGIVNKVKASEYSLYISGPDNFRKEEATIKPYKGNRPKDKPFWYKSIKDMFINSDAYPCKVSEGYEADDQLSIDQWIDFDKNDVFDILQEDGVFLHTTILCSRDKDLNMVPGWHYSWSIGDAPEKDPFFIVKSDGWANFFKQMLTGDTVDNIPGLFGVGDKSKAVNFVLNEALNPQLMYERVQSEYEKRFGSYWKMFMHENARLLWMLREPDDDIRILLDEYEQRRQSDIPF